MKKIRMQILLEEDQKTALEQEAKAKDVSVGYLIREAVVLYQKMQSEGERGSRKRTRSGISSASLNRRKATFLRNTIITCTGLQKEAGEANDESVCRYGSLGSAGNSKR